jgi:CheY-like chemotaxis protein
MNDNRVYLCVLEDDPAWSLPIIEAVKTHLPQVSIRVAGDGKTLLRMLSDLPSPNLLIFDENTPGWGGTETTRVIRRRDDLLWLPIVMYSSAGDPLTRLKAREAGVNAFVHKDPSNVPGQIKEIVHQYSYHGDRPERIEPPLLKESQPFSSSGWDALDRMFEEI